MNNTSKSDKPTTKNEHTGKPKDVASETSPKNIQDDLRQVLDMPDTRPSQFQGHVGI